MSSPNFIDYIKFNSRSGMVALAVVIFTGKNLLTKAAPTVAMVDVEVT